MMREERKGEGEYDEGGKNMKAGDEGRKGEGEDD